MEELSGISNRETCLISSFPACDNRERCPLGELQHHIAWTHHQQAVPITVRTETSAWAQTASD